MLTIFQAFNFSCIVILKFCCNNLRTCFGLGFWKPTELLDTPLNKSNTDNFLYLLLKNILTVLIYFCFIKTNKLRSRSSESSAVIGVLLPSSFLISSIANPLSCVNCSCQFRNPARQDAPPSPVAMVALHCCSFPSSAVWRRRAIAAASRSDRGGGQEQGGGCGGDEKSRWLLQKKKQVVVPYPGFY
jgi:hypothetical protein